MSLVKVVQCRPVRGIMDQHTELGEAKSEEEYKSEEAEIKIEAKEAIDQEYTNCWQFTDAECLASESQFAAF